MKKLLLLLVVVVVGAYLSMIGTDLLSLQYLQKWVAESPWQATAVFFISYVAVAALSLPIVTLMTLMAGMLFGLGWGLLLVSFASSIGATLACWVSRTLLRDWVQKKFKQQIGSINRGVEKDGAYYLFSLRLIPAVPFFVINLIFGLVAMPLRTFYWVSQLGMLAGTAVYVNAGVQLGSIESLSVKGILTPSLIGAFLLLAIFPWLLKALQKLLNTQKIYKAYKKPKQFDTNLLVIGAGSAGLVSAYIAAATKAKVTLIEKNKMGGDCLNTGCIPSKALLKTAELAELIRHSDDYGIQAEFKVDFGAVMARVKRVIEAVEPHDSIERYTQLGVDCVQGKAELISPWQVRVRDDAGAKKIVSAKNIVIATGAKPFVPAISGLQAVDYLTSDTIWQLQTLPQNLLVMGAGPIGCELAQAFARLGSRVTIVGSAERLLPREDADVSACLQQRFESEGISLLLGQRVESFSAAGAQLSGGDTVQFDKVLVAVGREANVKGFGLEELGIALTERNTIECDDYMRTNFPNIFACGDVVGPYQFTHMAAHQAWYACVNALFGWLRKFKVDYSVVPWATFTSPEVARVGVNELDAIAKGLDFEVTRYDLSDLDRAIADGSAAGFVKVLTQKGSDKIIGATIVGARASDLIPEFITAMKQGIGLNKILGTIHIYPTMSEANKYAAGNWKRAHAPEKLLRWVECLHKLRLK